jgi:cytochrome c553
MTRPWRFAAAAIVVIPIAVFTIGFVIVDRAVGREFAWAFVSGCLRGTQARPLTSITFERTSIRLQRGQYLVAVARCFSCHSETDPQTDLPISQMIGAGTTRQLMFRVTYPNITPDAQTGAGTWSDDMFRRAIREGVGHDGRALIPRLMPYQTFRYLSDEDVASIVVYLRSIAPVHHILPKTAIPFPLNLAVKGFPRPLRGPVPPPQRSDQSKRGEYLTRVGNCADCHETTDSHGHTLPYAGGQVISDHGEKAAAAANLTPDPSGISYYDPNLFIRVMRTGHVGARELAAAMPWRYFQSLSDEDLNDILAYLKTLRPVRHHVDNTEPVAYCKVCGKRHGGGELNR